MLNMPVPVPKEPKNRTRTGFSFYRFLIPEMCEYQGRAIYLDADMLVLQDISELWDAPLGERSVLCSVQELPDVWKHLPVTNVGRQFSVMLLNCERLPWNMSELVRGLDEGTFDYPQLVHKMCIVPPEQIGDDLVQGWNHLERYIPGETRLLHYTHVPTQPWTCRENPYFDLWMRYYREACAAGVVDKTEVLKGIEAGYLLPELADAFPEGATAHPSTAQLVHVRYQQALALAQRDAARLREELEQARDVTSALAEARAEAQHLREALHEANRHAAEEVNSLHRSWTWRTGRVVTAPLRRMKRGLLDAAALRERLRGGPR